VVVHSLVRSHKVLVQYPSDGVLLEDAVVEMVLYKFRERGLDKVNS